MNKNMEEPLLDLDDDDEDELQESKFSYDDMVNQSFNSTSIDDNPNYEKKEESYNPFDFNCVMNGVRWYDFYKVENNCFGQPTNAKSAAYCLLCWTFGFWCSQAKLMATHQNQKSCSCVNHCFIPLVINFIIWGFGIFIVWISLILLNVIVQVVFSWLFGFLIGAILGVISMCLWTMLIWDFFLWPITALHRRNQRNKLRVGGQYAYVADCCLSFFICTNPCTWVQIIKTSTVQEWDWFSDIATNGFNFIGSSWNYIPQWNQTLKINDEPLLDEI
eukprot:TRINITY_DN5778_c0_g4_i1.p1 TRINITY_DN5778_c0_g4~~TRINITY_DN5778_c0_g4_i1.p1  ORF type:complete len:275 (-),score=86.01 TRINITY_DN5778_c0_g4_i1:187-1011(-)